MEKATILMIVLIALVVVAGVQAVQLVSLHGKMAGGATVSGASGSAPVASGAPSGGVTAPENIQNLPQMVGGC